MDENRLIVKPVPLEKALHPPPEKNPPVFKWASNLGSALMSSVEVSIGGTVVDRSYGPWLDIWRELADDPEPVAYEMVDEFEPIEAVDPPMADQPVIDEPMIAEPVIDEIAELNVMLDELKR